MKKTITTYADARGWADAFADGHFDVFIMVGNPGLGKSRIIKDAVKDEARIIEGRTSAFGLYCEAYKHCDESLVIDDVDQLYTDRDAVRLLKCLCQTEPEKTLAWHSATSKLVKEEIPQEFTTTSKVAIIANIWKELNANVGAIEDRGILIDFKPTTQEVHEWVGTWYKQQRITAEVYRFIGKHLHLITEPSGRHYITAQQVKNAGQDWREALFETWGLTRQKYAAAELLEDNNLKPGQRVAKFKKEAKKSKSTFYRWRKKLLEASGKA